MTRKLDKPGKRGRKPKIDATTEARILAILEAGGSLKDAGDICGIDQSTLTRHRAKDRNFAQGVDRSIAEGKFRLIKRVGNAEAWQAAAWMLERRWGREYGKKDKVDVTSKGKGLSSWTVKPDGNVSEEEAGEPDGPAEGEGGG